MTKPQHVLSIDIYSRRRASDRARERASRAAYFGDRAGLLIATGSAEVLMSSRAVTGQALYALIEPPQFEPPRFEAPPKS
jgi:hypothetical protein